jgi:hypothetical protein
MPAPEKTAAYSEQSGGACSATDQYRCLRNVRAAMRSRQGHDAVNPVLARLHPGASHRNAPSAVSGFTA